MGFWTNLFGKPDASTSKDASRYSSDLRKWADDVLNDAHAWQFALAPETRNYLAGLSVEDNEVVVDRIIDVLGRKPEYWQFCTCTMLLEEGLGRKGCKAAAALQEYTGHPQESYRTQASRAIKAIGGKTKEEGLRTTERLVQVQNAGSDKSFAHKGQAGEPYCSDKCAELSAKTLSVAWLAADSGPCTFCMRAIVYGQSHQTKMFPYRNQKAFLCVDCGDQARSFFSQVEECCLCGKTL